MPNYLTVTPAYGRDYKSKKEVQADWDAGKDFIAMTPTGSGPVNKDDAPEGTKIMARYKRLTMVTELK